MFDKYYKYYNQVSLANVIFKFTIQIYYLFVIRILICEDEKYKNKYLHKKKINKQIFRITWRKSIFKSFWILLNDKILIIKHFIHK